jgi:hypothetical protein
MRACWSFCGASRKRNHSQPSAGRDQQLRAGITGNTSRNNVPNKRLISGTFLCAVLGTLRSRVCVPDTVLDVPDIIWNIPLLFTDGVAINSAGKHAAVYFCLRMTYPRVIINLLEVSQIVPETMLRRNDTARGNVAVKYTASEYGVFFAAHVTPFLL